MPYQHSFISNITLPLWQRLGDLFAGVEVPVANLQSNSLLYEAELTKTGPSSPSSFTSHDGSLHSVREEDLAEEKEE